MFGRRLLQLDAVVHNDGVLLHHGSFAWNGGPDVLLRRGCRPVSVLHHLLRGRNQRKDLRRNSAGIWRADLAKNNAIWNTLFCTVTRFGKCLPRGLDCALIDLLLLAYRINSVTMATEVLFCTILVLKYTA